VYLGGNVTTLSANNLTINDSLIYLANNNPANLNDIGFVGHFTAAPTGYQHTGLVRDAHDGVWKLFSNVVNEFANNTVDFSGAVYDTLRVGTVIGNNYGNANTATAFQSARLINGTSFDGSANITISANTFNSLTFGNGFNVGSFNGSGITTLIANTASTTLAGIVQLTDSVSSTSTTTAATPNSVKLSYDQATNAFNQANVALGVGQAGFNQANAAYNKANTVSISLTDDTATNATYYPVITSASSGSLTANVSSTNLTFNPSTGTLSSVIFNSLSDANKKENIQTLTGALEKTLALRGVSYDLKESKQPSIGLIAQEAEEIIPEVVYTDPEGNKSITYGNIIGLLIEAIKEQQQQIDELKKQINKV